MTRHTSLLVSPSCVRLRHEDFLCIKSEHLSLRPKRTAVSMVQFARVSLQLVKLSFKGCGFPNLLFGTCWGFVKLFPEPVRPSLLILMVVQILFPFTYPCFSGRHVQICITVGAFLAKLLTNARCTFLFNYVRVYSNTQNHFSFPVYGISVPENTKI